MTKVTAIIHIMVENNSTNNSIIVLIMVENNSTINSRKQQSTALKTTQKYLLQ